MQSRHSLELRQHQQLALTPQLQQSLRYLQLSTHELQQEVAQALQDNPLLEADTEYATDGHETVAEPDGSAEHAALEQDEHWAQAGSRASNNHADEEPDRPEIAVAATLHDHLYEQLRMTRAGTRDAALVGVLIEELDENGYLHTSLDEMLSFLPPELEVDTDELLAALRLLQSFDPSGVGARSLSECLSLQLLHRHNAGQLGTTDTIFACALRLARNHLELLAGGNFQQLREALGCDQDTLLAAHRLLLQLDPRPARNWATSTADYAIPDVLVRKTGRRWQVSVNPAVMPRVRVNPVYAQALADSGHATALQTQLQQAYGLIKSVSQRFATIVRVTQAIVDRQQAFFEQGMGAMRPLILRDIAQELEMHESTVSRATKQKYVQTPWGVIELKRFFGAALHTEDGTSTSATAVQTLIQKLINEEPAGKPLSDNRLAEMLAERGVVIARRTVAKYREAAGIAPASVRKARRALDAARSG